MDENKMPDNAQLLRTRHLEGGTPVLEDWGINSEYGFLRGVHCKAQPLKRDRV